MCAWRARINWYAYSPPSQRGAGNVCSLPVFLAQRFLRHIRQAELGDGSEQGYDASSQDEWRDAPARPW